MNSFRANTSNILLSVTDQFLAKCAYRMCQKELYNFESLYKFIQRTNIVF
jgi:hypothetical protein